MFFKIPGMVLLCVGGDMDGVCNDGMVAVITVEFISAF